MSSGAHGLQAPQTQAVLCGSGDFYNTLHFKPMHPQGQLLIDNKKKCPLFSSCSNICHCIFSVSKMIMICNFAGFPGSFLHGCNMPCSCHWTRGNCNSQWLTQIMWLLRFRPSMRRQSLFHFVLYQICLVGAGKETEKLQELLLKSWPRMDQSGVTGCSGESFP